ncbi:MAG TPA: hypothetical protein VGZ89_06355 [Xanthobacteraceae bacterium]|jgi:hypothetical protein|nr:hypothetical protein [Xanthobacteraceae bacterium]
MNMNFSLSGILSTGTAKYLGMPIVVVMVAWIFLPSAAAETKLSEFNGEWRGSGTDRSTPFNAQPTNCRMKIQADLSHMSSETICIGQAGLHKVLRLTITLDGAQFTGDASQTSTVTNGTSEVLHGTVVGHKSDEVASIEVRFPGLTPNATVALRRLDPSTFNMHITSLGLTLMDVTFNKAMNH